MPFRLRATLLCGAGCVPDVISIAEMMGKVLHKLAGIKAGDAELPGDGPGPSWKWCSVFQSIQNCATVQARVELKISSNKMSIPMPNRKSFVGRKLEIEDVANKLTAGSFSRVLVHGDPGVGKDVVAVQVALHDKVSCPGADLQAWLQGSTDEMLQRQIVEYFETHRPEVTRNIAKNEAWKAVLKWLGRNDGWLFIVEDAQRTLNSTRPARFEEQGGSCDESISFAHCTS